MAIVLALPAVQLFKIISENGTIDSYYIKMAARFAHFVFIQVFTLFFAYLFKVSEFAGLGIISGFFLLYSVLSAAAVALSLFELAVISNNSASVPERPPSEGE